MIAAFPNRMNVLLMFWFFVIVGEIAPLAIFDPSVFEHGSVSDMRVLGIKTSVYSIFWVFRAAAVAHGQSRGHLGSLGS
jgi:hypothetical protein